MRSPAVRSLFARCLGALCLSTSLALAMAPASTLTFQQDPKKEPNKAANDLLDAEREKLRMKDVEAWKKMQVKSMDQVADPKKTTQPLEYPASVTDADKAKMTDLYQKAKDGGGGARTGRALRDLAKMGFPALLFLVNELREVNYKDPDESLWAMQLNNTLSDITMGINAGYVAIDAGEAMDPRKAHWNAMTVAEWQRAVKQFWPTQEKFDEYIKNRKLKKQAELEGEGDEKKPGDKPAEKPVAPKKDK